MKAYVCDRCRRAHCEKCGRRRPGSDIAIAFEDGAEAAEALVSALREAGHDA